MGRGRVSAGEQGGVDQAGAGVIPLQVSTNQGGRLLARTLAKRGGLLQQPAGKLFGRIAPSLSRRRSEPGLAGRLALKTSSAEIGTVLEMPNRSVVRDVIRHLRGRHATGKTQHSQIMQVARFRIQVSRR